MQKQTSLYIPKPCREDWNKMTSTQQGKFCAGCSKQVIDFSLMSDHQILNVLSNQSGKLCGRFDAEQLQRPLVETKIKKKKSWWMALMMPLLFLFERNYAQGSPSIVVGDTTISPIEKRPEIMGKLIYHPTKQIMITGKVVDENNQPIAYATIMQKATKHGTVTDSLGNFTIDIAVEDSVVLVASYVGYETTEKIINVDESNISISMTLKPITLGDVVVVGKAFTGRLGGAIAICSRITTFEKIDTAFKKAMGISTIYPNPAIKGSTIHLEIKQAGEYQLQILDNQSGLIQTEEINTVSEKSANSIQLPANIASGIYYLRLINEQTKKQYTEKLIIQ